MDTDIPTPENMDIDTNIIDSLITETINEHVMETDSLDDEESSELVRNLPTNPQDRTQIS
jgi:hypothetical protein